MIEQRADRAVSDYIQYHRADAARELDFYRAIPALGKAIRRAARADTADGGKHPHQRRIPCDALREFGAQLARRQHLLRRARSFAGLHRVVEEVGQSIRGIGELAIYDTAHRIGARLSLAPRAVYLHRDTRSGAAAVGVDPRRSTVAVSELPAAFAALEPHEIEDCLCIFKGLLAGDPALPLTGCRCSGRGCARPRRRTARARC
ncbi:MAG: hypothetical protein OXG38_06990 [Chloroflexi bacterium]|nr:hypothetical protein [Chloroflexota bacterium]